MRVAILGMGAIGHVVARALDGRAELVRVDRTRAPLRDREAPVDAAIVTTKTPGTAWAAEVAAKILAPESVALTIQNGLGNYETLVEHVGRGRADRRGRSREAVAGDGRADGRQSLIDAAGRRGRPADGDRRDLRCRRARRSASWGPRSAQSGDDAARRHARLGRDGGLHLRVP